MFSASSSAFLSDVGVLQNVKPLRVRRHHAVLDSVVNHLHEVACAEGRSAIPLLRGSTHLLAARGAWDVSDAWR